MNLVDHLPVILILLPMLTGIILLLPPLHDNRQGQRVVSLAASVLMVILSATILVQSHTSGMTVYALGEWQPPFGIVLVVDQVAAIMLLLTAILILCSALYASAGEDNNGEFFHALLMFQMMGLNGAFLTGDIFNLFVFFEVLLIASYSLLIHGGGKQRTGASVHYVLMNLVGSAFFLFALGILYGTLGTLNMADMVDRLAFLDQSEQTLVKVAALLLLVVFGLKAAMLPLQFWLPSTYASASTPVAALFAIMTKVGIYSIWRVHGVIFGDNAGELANLALPWLWPLAILTLVIGTLGTLASQSLRHLAANLIIVSVGTLLAAIALNSPQATAAGLYYMIHSTLIAAALFMIAGMVTEQRGKAEDRFVAARQIPQNQLLGTLFAVSALIVIGMPPFSGFVGKLLVLQSATESSALPWVWPAILIAGLASLIALSRAGTTLFWRHRGANTEAVAVSKYQLTAVLILLSLSPIMVIFGGPLTELTTAAAEEFHKGIGLSQLLDITGEAQ